MRKLFFLTTFIVLSQTIFILQAQPLDDGPEADEPFWGAITSYRLKTDTIPYKSFELGLTGDYFSTTGYFDKDGNKTELLENTSYHKLDGTMYGGYGFGDKFDSTVGFMYRTHSSTQGNLEYSASGIESAFIEGKYRLSLYEKLKMAIRMEFRQKMYENDPATSGIGKEKMILGDDGYAVTVTPAMTYQRTDNHYLTGELGYRTFSGEISSQLPWLLESAWIMEKFALAVGFRGNLSMEEEEEGTVRQQFNQGATALFNAHNPSYTEPYLNLSFLAGHTRFGLELSQRIMGANTDQGYTILASLAWNSSNEKQKDKIKVQSVKEYSIEAQVIQVSPRGLFLKVDKGVSSEVEKGESADIYTTNYLGGNVLLASGIVYDTGVDWAIIKLVKRYKKVAIKKGDIARFK